MNKIQRQKAWECGLPAYLQHDLDAYKEGLRSGSTLIDCLWCELYGSINGAEIDDQAISHAPATAVLHTVSHTSTPDHVSITFDKEHQAPRVSDRAVAKGKMMTGSKIMSTADMRQCSTSPCDIDMNSFYAK